MFVIQIKSNMKKLSKEFRKMVYEKALDHYTTRDEGIKLGICNSVSTVMYELKESGIITDDELHEFDPYYKMEKWPEIWEQRPADIKYESYWWPMELRDQRINVLQSAIDKVSVE